MARCGHRGLPSREERKQTLSWIFSLFYSKLQHGNRPSGPLRPDWPSVTLFTNHTLIQFYPLHIVIELSSIPPHTYRVAIYNWPTNPYVFGMLMDTIATRGSPYGQWENEQTPQTEPGVSTEPKSLVQRGRGMCHILLPVSARYW